MKEIAEAIESVGFMLLLAWIIHLYFTAEAAKVVVP